MKWFLQEHVLIHLWQLIYAINQQRIRQIYSMDASRTPHDSEPITLEFQGRVLMLNETASGKINVFFDEMSQKFRYEAKNYSLQKINFKSVLAGVKGTHPQIILAKFERTQSGEESLVVKVSYEFLPQIVQKIVFEKKQIPAEESQQAMVRGMRTFIRGIREQLNSLGNIQILQGELDQTTDTQIFVKLNHRKTVFTWALNLKNLANNLIRVQFSYYNSVTKQRKSTGAIPEEGVYVHYSGGGYTEMKFLAQLEDFDMVIFTLQGKYKGDYTISSEKVQIL